MLQAMWTDLPQATLRDNTSYDELTRQFQATLFLYARCFGPAVKHIGGQYTYRDHMGDPDGRGPYQPISKERQLEAMSFLQDFAFAEGAFAVPAEVLSQLGGRYWLHWGMDGGFDGRKDFPFATQVLDLQQSLIDSLTSPLRLARIRDAELKFGAENNITIPELFAALTQGIWSEVWDSPGKNITTLRRDLQRGHLDRMAEILTKPPKNTPADARSVARWQLRDLNKRIGLRLTPTTFAFDAYTRAHLTEVQDRIAKVLDASIETK